MRRPKDIPTDLVRKLATDTLELPNPKAFAAITAGLLVAGFSLGGYSQLVWNCRRELKWQQRERNQD